MWMRIVVACVAGICGSAIVLGQNGKVIPAAADKYVISAKAGGINYIEGNVAVVRNSGRSGYLTKGDNLAVGERVSTDAAGKAEILLNPGSYMRIGGDTAFEFVSTSLDDLQINLNQGNAMFEVIVDDDFRVTLQMPKTSIKLTNSGVYRIDVLADGSSKVSVWKGKLELGNEDETRIKSGRSAVVEGTSATVAKFDRDEKDELELWSKDRAKELAKVNSRLQRNALTPSLISSFNGRGWNVYNSYGLWIFDRSGGGWSFLPFGYGWRSPYGYGFGFDIWNCRLPRYVFAPPFTGVGPTLTGIPGQRRTRDRMPLETPPFQRLENKQGGDGIVTRGTGRKEASSGGFTPVDMGQTPGRIGPTSMPPSSAPPPSERMQPPGPVERAPIKVVRDN